MIKILLYIFILFLFSCSNNDIKTEPIKDQEITMNQPSRPIAVLKDLALNKGDIGAYNELETAYLDFEHGSFFKIAKEMADKHNYPQAYYDTYIQTLKPTQSPDATINLDSCDLKTRTMAISYLRKSSELGFEPANVELKCLEKEGYLN